MEVAVNHAKPSYGRPPTTLPAGVVGANSFSSGSSGRGFFETLFGMPPSPPPQPQRPQRRVPQRQASN
jgi:L,D-transpeptidase YcbB